MTGAALPALPARWHSENGAPPPGGVIVADDRLRADAAHAWAVRGTAVLWQGDYHGARQLCSALARRAGADPHRPQVPGGRAPTTAAEAFRLHREERARTARVAGSLLVLLEADHSLRLRRAPDVRRACREAYGPPDGPRVVALRELLGVLGAQQWRERGVDVPALGARIHPHYGVFSPVRGEYVDLVARAPLPSAVRAAGPGHGTAFDLGTGSGVLAAVLARRGIGRVLATDVNPRALACAFDNAHRLGLADRVRPVGTGLYPPGGERAGLVVCNPPWLPARQSSPLDQGVYDPDGRMLTGFLDGLADRLVPGGEGWLILSDLAEHLGLRSRDELNAAFTKAGLRVLGRLDTRPRHRRAVEAARAAEPSWPAGATEPAGTTRGSDGTRPSDPLRAARAAEVTSLWRLGAS
ncbi:class I SAM-dependent methyltransferase [Streptomyces sp. BE303]|uniref:class I SAM-dependent methyltransferase n=1 Tax=Streptomyces sp. BE303 TaxID=3002528 RepID=UPI002E79809C|nr:class I SAM-dependent methyltransferase [Streptomyces sp. BE303]MED7955203.1 class I SAM-dependent methyltransferase [Streptomyces sp. BE303]